MMLATMAQKIFMHLPAGMPADDGVGRDGGDGAAGVPAGTAGARPPPKKKAKVPDGPFTRAGYGEAFEVKIELDSKDYSEPSLAVRMRRNATTGYPECVDPCPDRNWCTSNGHGHERAGRMSSVPSKAIEIRRVLIPA